MIEVEVKLPVAELAKIKAKFLKQVLKRQDLLRNMIHTLIINRET